MSDQTAKADDDVVLQVEDLKTWFNTPRGIARVVDGVSLRIKRGRALAVVGESGSGKTMLARSIMGLIPEPPGIRAGGSVWFKGQDLRQLPEREMQKLRGDRIAMIFQDPMSSLNPVLPIGEQIAEVLVEHLGMNWQQANARALELLIDVGVPSPEQRLKEYPHQLSGGLRQRVMIAIGMACRPDLLIADEPTTALDVSIQAQILRLMKRYQRENNMAMLFVSHDLGTVAGIADDIMVMYAGKVVEYGSARQVLHSPRMPYTRALLRAIPRLDRKSRLQVIDGRPPDLTQLPQGCAFAARCEFAADQCRAQIPTLEVEDGHGYACWKPVARTKEAEVVE